MKHKIYSQYQVGLALNDSRLGGVRLLQNVHTDRAKTTAYIGALEQCQFLELFQLHQNIEIMLTLK